MIDETIQEIREMRTHSSSIVATKATRSLAELLEREYATVDDFERDLEHNAGALRRANPSHASLHNAMRGMVRDVVGEADTVEGAKELTQQAIDRVVEDIDRGKVEAAANAAGTFEHGETFLTHENSSTVMAAIESALDDGKTLTAYVTEARPRYIGRKTARRMGELDGIDATLVIDGASGYFLPDCDRVVLGMNCIVGEYYYNRIGTLPLVTAANHFDVPVVVVGSSAKIIQEGFVFENELRSPTEVMLEPAEGFGVENPAYDEIPVDLLDRVITDEGVQRF